MAGADRRVEKVTYVLTSYNQERYIAAAVESALAQTFQPLRIIISDDASTDRSFDIIKNILANYSGLHRVEISRNTENLGTNAHLNQIFERIETDIIICAHGDDVAFPERTARLVSAFENNSSALLVHSAVVAMSQDGMIGDKLIPPIVSKRMGPEKIAQSMGLHIGASAAYHRKLFSLFGLLPSNAVFEDLILGFRAALMEGIFYVDEPLLYYRDGGISSPKKFDDYDSFVKYRLFTIETATAALNMRINDCKVFGSNRLIPPINRRLEKLKYQKVFYSKRNLKDWMVLGNVLKLFSAARAEFRARKKAYRADK